MGNLVCLNFMRDAYVRGEIYRDYQDVIDGIDETFDDISKDYIVVINGET